MLFYLVALCTVRNKIAKSKKQVTYFITRELKSKQTGKCCCSSLMIVRHAFPKASTVCDRRGGRGGERGKGGKGLSTGSVCSARHIVIKGKVWGTAMHTGVLLTLRQKTTPTPLSCTHRREIKGRSEGLRRERRKKKKNTER